MSIVYTLLVFFLILEFISIYLKLNLFMSPAKLIMLALGNEY